MALSFQEPLRSVYVCILGPERIALVNRIGVDDVVRASWNTKTVDELTG
jgi:hypothetical protein